MATKKKAPEVTEAVIEATKQSLDIVPSTAMERLELTVAELQVETDSDVERANDLLHLIKEQSDKWEAFWKPLIALAHKTHKGLNAQAKPYREQFKQFREAVETKVTLHLERKQKFLQAEQAKIDELAEQERRQRLQEAATLAEQGFIREAEEVATEAQLTPTPTLADDTPELDGTRTRRNWKVTITDKKAVILAVADGIIPLEAVEIKESFLVSEARKREGLDWPGIKAEQKLGLAVMS